MTTRDTNAQRPFSIRIGDRRWEIRDTSRQGCLIQIGLIVISTHMKKMLRNRPGLAGIEENYRRLHNDWPRIVSELVDERRQDLPHWPMLETFHLKHGFSPKKELEDLVLGIQAHPDSDFLEADSWTLKPPETDSGWFKIVPHVTTAGPAQTGTSNEAECRTQPIASTVSKQSPLADLPLRITWDDSETPKYGSLPYKGPPQGITILATLAREQRVHWSKLNRILQPGSDWEQESDPTVQKEKKNAARNATQAAFSRLRRAVKDCWQWNSNQLPACDTEGYYLLNIHPSLVDQVPTSLR